MRRAITRLEQRALASGQMYEPMTVDVNKNETVANITVPIAGTGTDAASNAAVATLRNEIVPETVGALQNAEAGVTGPLPSGRTAPTRPGRSSHSCSRSCSHLRSG